MFFSYLKLNILRLLKLLPGVMVMCLLLLLAIGLMGTAILRGDASKEEKQKIVIGLVGDTKASYLGLGIDAISKLDSSRYAVDFVEMEKAEAEKKLKLGQITGYAVIPDGYVDGLNQGVYLPIDFYCCNNYGMASQLVGEFTDVLSRVMSESIAAVIATGEIAVTAGEDFGKVTDNMLFKHLGIILNREDLFLVNELGAGYNLSFFRYMPYALFVLFLLVVQMTFAPFYCNRRDSVSRLLASKALNYYYQILAEYVPVFCGVLIISFLAGIGGLAAGLLGPTIFVTLFPICFCISAVSFFMYEISRDFLSASLVQCMWAVLMGMLSGCFFPVERAPFFLYPAEAIKLLCMGAQGKFAFLACVSLLVTGTTFLLISVLIRGRKRV